MNTSLIIILIVVSFILGGVSAVATARSRARRREENGSTEPESRGLVEMTARTAEHERLDVVRDVDSMQQQRTEAEEVHTQHAGEIDPDHVPVRRP